MCLGQCIVLSIFSLLNRLQVRENPSHQAKGLHIWQAVFLGIDWQNQFPALVVWPSPLVTTARPHRPGDDETLHADGPAFRYSGL